MKASPLRWSKAFQDVKWREVRVSTFEWEGRKLGVGISRVNAERIVTGVCFPSRRDTGDKGITKSP